MKKMRVVIPVYNDWASLQILLRELDTIAPTLPYQINVTAMDDGSTESVDADWASQLSLSNLAEVEIVHLSVNIGHQRAIAIGLCLAVEGADADAILIMDADGEDSPQAISDLATASGRIDDFCVVARRRKRSENLTFKFSYLVYKFAFRVVTGKHINFGNFMFVSASYARRLVMVPDLWNNLPAAVLRSRLPITTVPVDRAVRYAGKSKMSFTSLVVHGLSGISVYADTIFVRLLLLTGILACLTAISIVVVLALRLFYPLYATPGWATTVSFGMTIILAQVLSVTLSSILILLNSRMQRLILPIVDYKIYVSRRQVLQGAQRTAEAPMGFTALDSVSG